MRFKLTLPNDLEVEDVRFDSRTRILEMNLIFYGTGSEAIAGVIQTFDEDDGKTHGVCIMKVSGRTGMPVIQNRSARVVPPIEKKAKDSGTQTEETLFGEGQEEATL